MNTFKHLKFALTFAGFIIIYFVLYFIFVPIGAESVAMWNDFHKSNPIDLIYIGTSSCENDINPEVIDSEIHLRSYNMGTPSQSLQSSYIGIKEAIKTKRIKYVVLTIDNNSLRSSNKNADAAFMYGKMRKDSITGIFFDYIDYMSINNYFGKKESLNFFFPWIDYHVPIDKVHIRKNLRLKLENKDFYDYLSETNIYWKGNGYKYLKGQLNPDEVGSKIAKYRYKSNFSDKSMKILDSIIKLCNDNNVKLYVIGTPRPALDYLSLDTKNNFKAYKNIKSYLSKRGVEYYDFNLLNDDLRMDSVIYYRDSEHMTEEGATKFSKILADFIRDKINNRNTDLYFCTPSEYINSINYIASVNFNLVKNNNSVTIKSEAFTGTNVVPEFQIEIYDNVAKKYEIVRDYSTESDFTFIPKQKGKVKIRINSRIVGSSVPYERYFEKSVNI